MTTQEFTLRTGKNFKAFEISRNGYRYTVVATGYHGEPGRYSAILFKSPTDRPIDEIDDWEIEIEATSLAEAEKSANRLFKMI